MLGYSLINNEYPIYHFLVWPRVIKRENRRRKEERELSGVLWGWVGVMKGSAFYNGREKEREREREKTGEKTQNCGAQ